MLFYLLRPCGISLVSKHAKINASSIPLNGMPHLNYPLARDYILPFGKANIILGADKNKIENGETCAIITYGMGVYWAKAAAKKFNQQVEIVDLRTLYPLDENLLLERIRLHGKCLIVTEERQNNSFAEALAGRISKHCFQWLDAPVDVIGALNLPAVPMNMILEKAMLPDAEKVAERIKNLLAN